MQGQGFFAEDDIADRDRQTPVCVALVVQKTPLCWASSIRVSYCSLLLLLSGQDSWKQMGAMSDLESCAGLVAACACLCEYCCNICKDCSVLAVLAVCEAGGMSGNPTGHRHLHAWRGNHPFGEMILLHLFLDV